MLQLVHSSTRNALTGRSPLRSSILSLRYHGVSHRLNVSSRVFVSVVDHPTYGTGPFSDRKGQRFNDMPAVEASLAGREKSVDLYQHLPIPLALVLQHLNERAETGIADRTGDMVVLNHAPDVQVLCRDKVESAHEAGSDLLEVVVPRISDSLLQFGYCDSGSFPPAATFLAPSVDSLQPRQFLDLSLEMLRIRDSLASGQRGESVDAQIYPDRGVSFRKGLDNFIKHQSDVVPSSRRLGYRNGGRTTGERLAPANINLAELGDGKDSVFVLEPARCVFSRLLPTFLFESRVASTLLEERLKRGLKMPKRLLRRDRRYFLKPLGFRSMAKFGEEGGGSNVVDLFSPRVSVRSQAQHCVVRPTAGTEHPRKYRSLFGRWVDPEPLAYLHKSMLPFLRPKVKRKENAIPPPPEGDGILA